MKLSPPFYFPLLRSCFFHSLHLWLEKLFLSRINGFWVHKTIGQAKETVHEEPEFPVCWVVLLGWVVPLLKDSAANRPVKGATVHCALVTVSTVIAHHTVFLGDLRRLRDLGDFGKSERNQSK